LTKIRTDPEVDAAYQPHDIQTVAFYGTQYPNTCFDISHTMEKKKQALLCYHAQFHEDELKMLAAFAEYKASQSAKGLDCKYAEMWKVVTPRLLHGFPETWKF
jgi:LmbE family N-acetylglucosaminyl deacetylase